MSDSNQILNSIKEELQNPIPDRSKILNTLMDLRRKAEFQQHLSDSEFFDIVGETFSLNPEFFMEKLFEKFRYNIGRLIGGEKLKEMDKYILEKFCLYDGEQILYEFKGNMKQEEMFDSWDSDSTMRVSVTSGNIFITNDRIIALGIVSVRGGRAVDNLFWALITGRSKRAERKKTTIEISAQQELPCYGYQFPIKNQFDLKKSHNGIRYREIVKNRAVIMRIYNLRFDYIDKIFEVVSKCKSRDDASQVLTNIKNIIVLSNVNKKIKAEWIVSLLHDSRAKEEYQHISDSEYVDIVGETYMLNPNFFLNSIYPKMKAWTFPSFLSIKEEIIEHIEILLEFYH